jgi:hypothetical protein
MLVEEGGDLAERLGGLGDPGFQELRMTHGLEDLQRRGYAGLPQLAVRPDSVAEQQVARPGREDRRRQAAEVTEDR